MKQRCAVLAAIMVVLVAVGLLTGCGSGAEKSDETEEKTSGSVTSESKEVQVGDEFKIELESNATTGYDWKMTTGPDTAILGLTQDEYIPPQSSAAGAPGMHVWRFKALSAGSTKMVFEYARSWETDVPPAQTHNVSVVVQ